MLDRLTGHAFYYCLNGYSGYNQILVAPKEQKKAILACLFGTFTYKRMSFGLYNAAATF